MRMYFDHLADSELGRNSLSALGEGEVRDFLLLIIIILRGQDLQFLRIISL